MTDIAADYADRESAIEETVTDIVERWFDDLSADNDDISQMIEDLAEKLGIAYGPDVDEMADGGYGDLMNQVIRLSWIGMSIKLTSLIQDRMMSDAKADLA